VTPLHSKTIARPYQEHAYQFLAAHRGGILGISMGGGKSKVAVDYIVSHNLLRSLIVAPPSVVNVWPNQFRVHGAHEVAVLALSDKRYSVAQRTELAQRFIHQHGTCKRPHCVVVNHEAIWREPFQQFALESGFQCLVIDESHRCQDAGAKLSRFAMKAASCIPHRIALSGTPTPNSEADIFSQARFVNPAIFGWKVSAFGPKYCQLGGYTGTKRVGIRAEMRAEFTRLVSQVLFVVTPEEMNLNLPEITHSERTCQLSPTHRQQYEELKHTYYTELAEGEHVTAVNAGVKLLRLQQFTSGHVKLDDHDSPKVWGDHKEQLLLDTLRDVQEPVVVFTRFTEDLNATARCAATLGLRYGEVSGRRKDLTAEATLPDNIDVLGVNLKAGSLGIDLSRAALMIFYSVGHSLVDYEQALKREHRPGQSHPVRVLHLLCHDSVDEQVYTAIRNKHDIVQAFLASVQQLQQTRPSDRFAVTHGASVLTATEEAL